MRGWSYIQPLKYYYIGKYFIEENDGNIGVKSYFREVFPDTNLVRAFAASATGRKSEFFFSTRNFSPCFL